MPLWLSHISCLVITDTLLSSQILGGHRQVFVACLCLPYTPPTFLSKAAMPAYKSKPSHTAMDRVAQPRFHFLFTTSSFCGPTQILDRKYTGGSLIKSICPRPLPAAFIIWPKPLVVEHSAPKGLAAPATSIAFLGGQVPRLTGYICVERQKAMGVIRPRQHDLACLLMVCVQEHLHRGYLTRQLLWEIIWVNLISTVSMQRSSVGWHLGSQESH